MEKTWEEIKSELLPLLRQWRSDFQSENKKGLYYSDVNKKIKEIFAGQHYDLESLVDNVCSEAPFISKEYDAFIYAIEQSETPHEAEKCMDYPV